MNSVDLLKGIYHVHLKSEPSKLSETLGTCFSLLTDHDVLPQVLRLVDLSSSPLQKAAQEIITKWMARIQELVSLPAGTGEDRNRAAALLLFAHLIANSSFELMHANKENWIKALTILLTRKGDTVAVTGLGCVALAQLIVKASSWDQARRDVLKDNVIGLLMNTVVKHLEEGQVVEVEDSVRALYIVLKANLKSRVPIDRLFRALLRVMDAARTLPGKSGLQLYQNAARCIPLLVDSGSTWAALFENLILAAHHLLEDLYVGFDDEIALIKPLLPKHALTEADPKPIVLDAWNIDFVIGKTTRVKPVDTPTTLHRVTILSHLMQLLLSAPLTFTVDLPVLEILVMVRHLMLLDGTRASPDLINGLVLGDLLLAVPTLHQCALLLLETLVTQFKSQLFPFLVPIADLVQAEFSNSRNAVASPILASVPVQCSLYRVTSTLLEVFQMGIVGLAPIALHYCFEDLQLDVSGLGPLGAPQSALAELLTADSAASAAQNSQAKQNPNKKKAAAKALSDPRAHINAESLTTTAQTSAKDDELRLAALTCLRSAISWVSHVLNDDLRSVVDKVLIGLCIAMARHPNQALWRQTHFEPAFANPAIRHALLEAVLASALSNGRLQATILPYAQQFLSLGSTDPELRVASFCSHALDEINSLIHPRVPLLPPSIADEQRTNRLSTTAVLTHQSDQLLLQQQEERTLLLLQRTQARRPREDNDEMEDDRPTKRTMTTASNSNQHHSIPSFLDSLTQMASNAPSSGSPDAPKATMTTPTVLFKTQPKTEAVDAPKTSDSAMAVDVDIVDDGPDSEDEE